MIAGILDKLGFGKQKTEEEYRNEELDSLEKQLNRSLPKTFRHAYVTENLDEYTGYTCSVEANDESDKTLYYFVIHKFLVIDPKNTADIFNVYNNVKSKLPIPELIPIAYDGFRNIMAMNLKNGALYYWDVYSKVEEEIRNNNPILAKESKRFIREDRLYYVAKDFDAFLDKLYKKSRYF